MPNSPAAGDGPRRLDRLTDWILDRDGDLYGTDQRERLRWYEGAALAASLHWLVLPWLVAVLVWFAGAATAHALFAVLAVTLLSILVMDMHVRRGGVRTESPGRSRTRTALTVAYVLPYPVFLLGYARASGIGFEGAVRGAVTAAVVLLALTGIGLVMGRRRGATDARQ